MQNKRIFTLLAMAVMIFGLLAATSCKSSGMAMTSRGQLFKINIYTPKTLPEGGEGNIDVELSNRGVNNVQDILADVELPPQLIILDQTSDRGINVMHDQGSPIYHFTVGNLQPGETTHIRFHVRTAFGTLTETGQISVTAWQKDLPGDKLFRKTVIDLQR
ncbi:MAG TPA: hypothetical protein VKL19_05040 [Thermoanaerobaculia bacterium]|nr:hypothetical protein [Thermoanaerobaculia bacterium]